MSGLSFESKEQFVKYIKDNNLRTVDDKTVDEIAGKLYDCVKSFEPGKLTVLQEAITLMTTLGIKKASIQDVIFSGLTGHTIKELQEAQKNNDSRDDDVIDAEYEVIDEQDTDISLREEFGKLSEKGKQTFNRVADSSIANLTVNMTKFGIKSYRSIRGQNKLGNIVKGALVFGVDLTAILAGSTAILAARTLRFSGKVLGCVFRAAKGTAQKAMHKSAVKRIDSTREKLGKQKDDLEALLTEKAVVTDERAATFGESSEFHKKFTQLRTDRESSLTAVHDCEDLLGSAFDQTSLVRDDNLARLVNSKTIEMLKGRVGFEDSALVEDKIFDFIEQLTFDKDGNPVLPEGYEDIDLSSLEESEMEDLRCAVEKSAFVHETSDVAKLQFTDYVECVDGKVQLKDGVNIDELPEDVKSLIDKIEGMVVDEELFNAIGAGNQTLEYLISCQEELLIRTSILATQDMQQILEDRAKNITTEQRGFFKSAGELGKSLSIKAQAKAIVEKRIGSHIMEAITRNSGASDRLMEIAHERLIDDRQASQEEVRDDREGPQVDEEEK